jgi:hypothetical protein
MAKPDWMLDLDQNQIGFYLGLDPAVAVCRGKRRHKFPGLVPGRPLPRTIDITRPGGIYQVTEHCERGCGRFITYSAGRDGRPDYSTARYGGWRSGEGGQLATGLGLTAGDDSAYMAYIQAEAVTEGFRLAEKRRLAAKRQQPAVPPAAQFREPAAQGA